MTRAAVDVGTNSVRLLVLDPDGRALAREMEITRLGRGVDRRGRLDDDALDRTLETLRRYRAIWESHAAASVTIAATSAIRDAADRERFFSGVREVTGREARVLTGEEEAATAFAGATGRTTVDLPAALLDVGGGSTEVVVGDRDGRVTGSVSLQLGCVRLTERCIDTDPPTEEELRAARSEADAAMDEAAERLASAGADPSAAATLIGVAGTVTTLAALHLGLDGYDPEEIHGTRIPRAVVDDLTERLAAITASDRAALGPMAAGREDVIVAGAIVVAAAMQRFGFEEIVASEADILDGLARLGVTPPEHG